MNKKIRINEKDKWITYKDEERIPAIIEEKIWNKANKKLSKKNKKES